MLNSFENCDYMLIIGFMGARLSTYVQGTVGWVLLSNLMQQKKSKK